MWVWTGRIISALAALILLLDGAATSAKAQLVAETVFRLGYGESVIPGIGIVLFASTVLYVMPRTSVFGAFLLTGFLGGASASHLRLGDPMLLFPIVLGVLIWGGLYLRDRRVRTEIPTKVEP